MADLIDREDLLQFLEKKSEGECQSCTDVECLACVEQWVSEQPAVDAAPVRHGRWICKRDNPDQPSWTTRIVCSVCGLISGEMVVNGNYCPNCGAKMDLTEGGDNHANDGR